jgi:SAM-dependent methyltransferase
MRLPRLANLLPGATIDRDDVDWCYRTLLGRPPESEDALSSHLGMRSFRDLVQSFTGSAEFARVRSPRRFKELPLPPVRIDFEADEAALQEILVRMRGTWQLLGRTRAHYSVMTSEAFLPEHLSQSIELFWESGDDEAAQAVAFAQAQGLVPSEVVCVEFGCGVGRVTGGLGRSFGTVHGCDISDSHLEEARERIQSLGLGNVQLHLCSETLLQPLPACDMLYSRIVLQHNPPPLMVHLVRLMLGALRPGGLAVFQLPTYAEGYAFALDQWLAAPAPQDMEMHCLPQECVLDTITEMGCRLVELREDNSAGDDRYISNLFVVRRPA